jgi:DNA-binding response OmpR family regulator
MLMAKILLVEDDDKLSKKIKSWLEMERHAVECSNRGHDALERLKLSQFDLIILDWQLPELEGIDILIAYRAGGGKSAVLMLTGRDDIKDKLEGLNCGADDYLTKPFHLEELSARIRALVRSISMVGGEVLRAGALELNTSTHRVSIEGKEVKLQPKEFALLEFMLHNPKEVFSVEALLNSIWPSEPEASEDNVRVCIARLRNKIDLPGSASIIRTVHRRGYQIESGD